MAKTTTISKLRVLPVRPVWRYSPHDSVPIDVRPLSRHTAASLSKAAGVAPAIAAKIIVAARQRRVRSPAGLAAIARDLTDVRRLAAVALFENDSRVVIKDVRPRTGPLMSHRPFTLRVWFTSGSQKVELVSFVVEWAGQPFTVERRVTTKDRRNGFVDVPFGRKQTLPVGPATFHIQVLTDRGGKGAFRVTAAVLPSNPFSLTLSPRDAFVTGTFSARAVRQGGSFATAVTVTLSNGNASAVTVRRDFSWEFWDGGVGTGSRIENGTGSFPSQITVPAHGTWSGWIAFTSPSGSGVFGKLDGEEDLTLKIGMTRTNDADLAAEITVRTMFRFGLNITRVGAESFTSREYTDLYNAVDVTRTIYERRDVTLSVDRRNITNAQADGFTTITSENEARDLFDAWSGPANAFIDVFVVPSISGTSFDGLAGDIPGPTSHDGRESGVVVDKSGFVDGSGTRRLNVSYLGMLIGHEVGHYLGLSHVSDAGNLMLSSSGASDTHLNYDPQYRTVVRHGWVRID